VVFFWGGRLNLKIPAARRRDGRRCSGRGTVAQIGATPGPMFFSGGSEGKVHVIDDHPECPGPSPPGLRAGDTQDRPAHWRADNSRAEVFKARTTHGCAGPPAAAFQGRLKLGQGPRAAVLGACHVSTLV